MGEKQAFTLTVNGQQHSVTVLPQTNLMDVLRDELHLTGTKDGCATGHCGSCMIIRDGEAAALGARDAACLAAAGAQLKSRVAVLLFGTVTEHLDVVQLQHGDRHMLAGFREDAGHAHLLCDNA